MASYQLRLEHKKKTKEFTQSFALITSLQWEWIKSKFIQEKLFHRVIIDDINKQLESGVNEVRYYKYSDIESYTGFDMYESLEDNYEFYKNNHINKENMCYTEELYVVTLQLIQEYFSRFEDIEFHESGKDMCSYFSIKTKF